LKKLWFGFWLKSGFKLILKYIDSWNLIDPIQFLAT
jgi:hypothetical protein